MPRIPVRTEPYTSPARQQRHYKNKRDQMLRTLGKASYINGSHFAILLVSAKGEVETFASELLKPCLSSWFNGNVVEEARNMATRSRTVQQQQRDHQQHNPASSSAYSADGSDAKVESSPANVPILSFPPTAEEDEMSMDDMPQSPSPSRSGSPLPLGSQNGFLRPIVPARSQSVRDVPRLPSIDTSVANSAWNKYRSSSASYASSVASASASTSHSPNPASTTTPAGGPAPILTTLVIPMENLEQWYTEKLHSLQQTTCKLVAKCWIKVIEPKKQTKHPYNLGEEGKPIWWPKGLQHREPDHLLKPERTQLLLAILRSPLILVSRLELSTAEQNHLIPPERIAILRELYKVAREDEKRRRGEVPADQEIVVQVPASTISSLSRTQPWSPPSEHGGYAIPSLDELDFPRKRARLSDQENEPGTWRAHHEVGGPLQEQVNGVHSPSLHGEQMPLSHCMPGLGQPIDMSRGPSDAQFMYGPPPTYTTLQLPVPGAGDFYYHSPDGGSSRPLTASTIDSGPSRPMTAMTSSTLDSDVPDERMQYISSNGTSLGVPHLLQRSHSFPSSAVQHLDMNFASSLQYPSQASAASSPFVLEDHHSSQPQPPNPFGFVDANHSSGGPTFTFSMPVDHHNSSFGSSDPNGSFSSSDPNVSGASSGSSQPYDSQGQPPSMSASPDSWSSPIEEPTQTVGGQQAMHHMRGALGLHQVQQQSQQRKDSPSMGMMQWLNESVHGTPAVDNMTQSTPINSADAT